MTGLRGCRSAASKATRRRRQRLACYPGRGRFAPRCVSMTTRKADIRLANRPTAFVTREEGRPSCGYRRQRGTKWLRAACCRSRTWSAPTTIFRAGSGAKSRNVLSVSTATPIKRPSHFFEGWPMARRRTLNVKLPKDVQPVVNRHGQVLLHAWTRHQESGQARVLGQGHQ
jgi:hypothetical protein